MASDEEHDAPRFLNPYAPIRITRASLPHWQQDEVTYFTTFSLVDSLPRAKLVPWMRERDRWLAEHPEPRSEEDWEAYHERFSATLERWLDQGSGSRVLQIPECRLLMANAVRHFAGERYRLGEFVVAPNHVHVVLVPLPGHDLSGALHSWKSFTAKRISGIPAASRRLAAWWDGNHACRCEAAAVRDPASPGCIPYQRPVWQKESYDHIVRSAASLSRIEE